MRTLILEHNPCVVITCSDSLLFCFHRQQLLFIFLSFVCVGKISCGAWCAIFWKSLQINCHDHGRSCWAFFWVKEQVTHSQQQLSLLIQLYDEILGPFSVELHFKGCIVCILFTVFCFPCTKDCFFCSSTNCHLNCLIILLVHVKVILMIYKPAGCHQCAPPYTLNLNIEYTIISYQCKAYCNSTQNLSFKDVMNVKNIMIWFRIWVFNENFMSEKK